MSDRMHYAYIIGVGLAVGVTAGTAAALSASVFPYALGFALNIVRYRRRKEHKEQKHRAAKERSKRQAGPPSKELQSYREAILKGVVDWKDADVTFDTFPYHVSEATKNALLDATFLHLKRPDFGTTIGGLPSMSPRILLTGPPGSELCQEKLAQAVAHHWQVKCVVYDSLATVLQASDTTSSPPDVDGGAVPEEVSPSLLSLVPVPEPLTQAGSSTTAGVDGGAVPPMRDSGKRSLRKGDRVRYAGPAHFSTLSTLSTLSSALSSGISGVPPVGLKGRVVLLVEESPGKVGVRFDRPIVGGHNLLDLCEDGHGSFCNVADLRLEGQAGGEDAEKMAADALIEVLNSDACGEACVVFIRDAEKVVGGHYERYLKLERMDRAGTRVVLLASHTAEPRKEKSGPLGGYGKGQLAALLDLSMVEQLGARMEESKGDGSRTSRLLSRLFPNKIVLGLPGEDVALRAWEQQVEEDAASLKAERNRQRLQVAMKAGGVECREVGEICINTHTLGQEGAERIVGGGASHHLQNHPETAASGGKLVICADSLRHGVGVMEMAQAERERERTPFLKRIKDVVCDNEFEKGLLSEVIPPCELGVTFEHIGALDAVKETLKEVVMLPLQRPELFLKGQLAKPVRGLLLFGPPGTGKTMLAKAVATEAGANFINISTATISSKWFGEAEKYVKAVFTLATKIAPSVIFIDEVDSMLGRRGKESEHSAMRKVKNELMSSWDGLRTRDKDRVLLLAATNRPFDLDDAVIRRFPRRIMIDLPDAHNRAKILKLILAEEDLAPDFAIDDLAAAAEGYSGSDLKNVCITAAYSRIREIVEREQKERDVAKADGKPPPIPDGAPFIRPITNEDMKAAMDKVRSSVATDTTSMVELTQWNEQFGEGGTGKLPTLTYFM